LICREENFEKEKERQRRDRMEIEKYTTEAFLWLFYQLPASVFFFKLWNAVLDFDLSQFV